MPNQRASGIVNVSFSMPGEMANALERRAKMEMTNKSEIVRRAIMAFLTPQEVASIKQSIVRESSPKKKRA
jgi:metal-responsive CopG/Arc/MetJ family transcriptional regulator